ncbi:hypothetical protein BsWGS_25635 [Bradybaena similaris]
MPSPNKAIDVKSPGTPNEKAKVKTSNQTLRSATPDLKSKSQASNSRKQSLTKTEGSRSGTPDTKSKTKPSDSKSAAKDLDEENSKSENDEGETDVANDEASPEEQTFYTEPSDEDGKMNTAVLVRPETADAATDTNDDDTEDECGTSGSEHSKRYSRNPCRSEFRYARCESAGNERSDSRRMLNRYCSEYLQPSMSSVSRFECHSRQTDTYSDVVRPFRYCGYSAKPDFCSRRF